MDYFGVVIGEQQLAKACRSSPISGTTGTNLVKGAQRFGFSAKVVDRSSFSAIEKWLHHGIPVIVDWMSTVSLLPNGPVIACGHYSVVSGLGPTHITLQDPESGGIRTLPRTAFLRVWYDFKRVSPQKTSDLVIRRLIVVIPKSSTKRAGRFHGLFVGEKMQVYVCRQQWNAAPVSAVSKGGRR